MSVYRPAKGAQYGPDMAQALGETLEQIGFSASPRQIVDAARPAASPIHALFEWDNDAAAEAYRRWQARLHTNHLVIVVKTDAGPKNTKAFHSVVIHGDDGSSRRAYCHAVNVAENDDLSEQSIAYALAQLNSWRIRYAEYRGLFQGLFREIDAATRNGRAKPKRRKPRRRPAKAGASS